MSRFEYIGNRRINVDHVEKIEPHVGIGEDNNKVIMTSGDYFWATDREVAAIDGFDAIRQIVPCDDTVCIYKGFDTDEYFRVDVKHLAVTESGAIRPVTRYEEEFDFVDDITGFVGLFQKSAGVVLSFREEESYTLRKIMEGETGKDNG